MTKIALKPLFATIVGAAALSSTLTAEPAQAFSMTYDFTVNITAGTYSGKSYAGSFKYDNANLTGSGLEFVSPTVGNLGIQFSFLNKSYTQLQDRDASLDFPRAYFQDGTLLGLSFLVVPPTSSPGFFIVPKNVPNLAAGFYVGNTDAYNGTLVGSVSYKPRSGSGSCSGSSCQPVPEPSEIAGTVVAIGLLGLGLKLRKRYTAAQKK